jgi:hypothetical protein
MTLGMLDFRDASRIGMSDEQIDSELKAQKRLAAAVAEMLAAVDYVNENSVIVEIEPSAFENLVHDEFPEAQYWAEKLAMFRYG